MFSPCREVFKAKHRQTGKKVALKKVLMENEKEGVRTCSSILCCTVDYADVTHFSISCHPVFCSESVFVLSFSVSHHSSEGDQDLTAAET